MKSAIIFSAILTFAMTSFTINYPANKKVPALTSEEVALHVVTALQHSSANEYTALFPSLKEFHSMMDTNSSLYGDFLPEAKQEFAAEYEHELIHTVKESFENILQQGKQKGIDWSNIHFERFESGELSNQPIAAAPLTIVFSANGKEYRFTIEKALVIHDQWKVSQFIRLV